MDAICIDQENLQERESQVRMMSQIYRQAEIVLADIGDVSLDSEGGLNHSMEALVALMKMEWPTRIELVHNYTIHRLLLINDDG